MKMNSKLDTARIAYLMKMKLEQYRKAIHPNISLVVKSYLTVSNTRMSIRNLLSIITVHLYLIVSLVLLPVNCLPAIKLILQILRAGKSADFVLISKI